MINISQVDIVTNPSMYFAEELDEAIQVKSYFTFFFFFTTLTLKGLGSDDDTIIRIFVSRSEVDLNLISKKFKEFSGRDLASAIEQVNKENMILKSSSDYHRILVGITRRF